MIIILEGTDCAGKTTIAQQLIDVAGDQGVEGIRTGAKKPDPGANPLAEYELGLRPYRDEILSPGHLVVLDRWHLGELVYGPILRGGSRLTPAMFEHVERYLDALGAVRAVVTPTSAQELRQRFRDRGDELVDMEQIMIAWRRFLVMSTEHHWHHVFSPAEDHHMDTVLTWTRLATQGATRLAPFPGYVGSPTPLLLLVGDEPNGHVAGEVPNPAFLPWGYNSGHFLLDTILGNPMLGAFTQPYGMCNANDGTDVHALWTTLGQPRTVALGRRAQFALADHDVPCTAVSHPQWVRRFAFRDQIRYGYSLAGVN